MTARSKVPETKNAALGVRSHSGWAAYVVLAGNPKSPDIVARGRMVLCDHELQGSKQPFHEAEPMSFAKAKAFIELCAASSARLAAEAVAEIVSQTEVTCCCVLTAAGRPLPDVKTILKSHALIHSAEGEFYRDAICTACNRMSIAVRRVRERDMDVEIQKLPRGARERVAEFGKLVGPPWTADEKMSAFGAWLMLDSLPSRHRVA